MANIDSLTIQVKASSASASKDINRLTAAIEALNRATKGGGMIRIAHETKEVSRATETATKGAHKFLASITRIAKYRLLRTALKEITQAFREGIGNLYQYSTALNSADAAANKNTMDQYASSLLYLKNSAGAAAGPLLQALLPVVQQLVEWFVAGANAVNQFISALQGKSTFTKAVYTMTEFGDEAQRASGAVKELKRTVLGFDELNLLQVDKNRGGGGGASTPDYSKMFEEEEIGSGFKKVAEIIKPILDWIADTLDTSLVTVGLIGTALLKWKIPQKLYNFFKNDIKGAWEALKLFGSTTAGGIFGGIAVSAGLAAVAIGLVTKAYNDGREAMLNSAEYAKIVEIGDDIAKNWKEAQQRVDAFGQSIEKWRNKFDKIELAKHLVDEIFSIYNSSNKTKDMIDTMQTKINQLNGLNLEGLKITYNSATGKIEETEKAIRGVIDAIEDQARTTALQDLLVEAYRLQFGLSANMQNLSRDEAAAYNNYVASMAEYTAYMNSHTGGNLGFWESVAYGAAGGYESSQTFAATDSKAQELAQRADEAKKAWENSQKAVHDVGKELEKANQTVEDLENLNLYTVLYGAAGAAKDLAERLTTAHTELSAVLSGFDSLKKINLTNFVNGIIDASDALYTAKVNAYNLYSNLNNASKYKLRKMDQYALNNAYVEYDAYGGISLNARANGGYVDSGQLFVARESGPEMVGSIGGRTAVANNDQIVEAISNGVFQAVSSAMGNSNNGDTHISIQVGEYELAEAVVSALNSQTRRIGYSQLEGI